jgi:hypothetical protein
MMKMKVLIFNNEVLLPGIVSTQLICKLFIGTGAETAPTLPVYRIYYPVFRGCTGWKLKETGRSGESGETPV